MKPCVLFADDDAGIRLVVGTSLSRAGYEVRATDNPDTLMKWVEAGIGDVVLTDVHMAGTEIFDYIPAIQQARPDLPILVISANTRMVTALKSGRSKVFEYIPKPFDLEKLEVAVKRAVSNSRKIGHPANISNLATDGPVLLGRSAAMQPVFRAIADYADADISLFIDGEAGSGKSLVAQCVHMAGKGDKKPFIPFSEVAKTEDPNLSGSSLFVDRLAELAPQFQTGLLELLEANEQLPKAERFRLIVMSNTPLEDLRESGTVRRDLLSYLTGAQITIPPLRERARDILDLAEHFMRVNVPNISPRLHKAAQAKLLAHDWPGNVRELQNLMQVISLRYADSAITSDMIGSLLVKRDSGRDISDPFADLPAACRSVLLDETGGGTEGTAYEQALAWVEKPLLQEALRLCGGNNSKAAEMLGIHRNTLRTRLKKMFG